MMAKTLDNKSDIKPDNKTIVQLPPQWEIVEDLAPHCQEIRELCQANGIQVKHQFGYLSVTGPERAWGFLFTQTYLEPRVSMYKFCTAMGERAAIEAVAVLSEINALDDR